MTRFRITLGRVLSDFGQWLDRKGCAMAERARYAQRPRRVKPLRFRNEGEIRLVDLNEMFAASMRRQAEASAQRIIDGSATDLDKRFAEIGSPLRATDYNTDKWDHWK